MNTTQLATLATELADSRYTALLAAQDYEAVAALLNVQPEIANPIGRTNTAKRIAWDTFMGLLVAGDVLKLYGYGSLAADLRAANDANNTAVRAAIWRGLKTVLAAGSITAVETEFAETEPDPAWAATVLGPSRATALGLPRILPADIQDFDNQGGA